MKTFVVFLFLALIIVFTPVYSENTEFNSCIKRHMKNVQSNIAAKLIQQACEENYGITLITFSKHRKYNERILKNLIGVNNYLAAAIARNKCAAIQF